MVAALPRRPPRHAVTIGELLPGAAAREELTLDYQPLCDLETHHILGFEALLRWTNPELGMVSPDQFIPVAEATGQIIEIGEWVLAHALDQLARWRCRALDLRVVAEGIETNDNASPSWSSDARSDRDTTSADLPSPATQRGSFSSESHRRT